MARSRLKHQPPPSSWGDSLCVRYVTVLTGTYAEHYSCFSNSHPGFLQHSMWDGLLDQPYKTSICGSWRDGHVSVKQAFAWAVV